MFPPLTAPLKVQLKWFSCSEEWGQRKNILFSPCLKKTQTTLTAFALRGQASGGRVACAWKWHPLYEVMLMGEGHAGRGRPMLFPEVPEFWDCVNVPLNLWAASYGAAVRGRRAMSCTTHKTRELRTDAHFQLPTVGKIAVVHGGPSGWFYAKQCSSDLWLTVFHA